MIYFRVQKAMGSSKAVETDMKKSNQLLSPNTRALLCQYAASASGKLNFITLFYKFCSINLLNC